MFRDLYFDNPKFAYLLLLLFLILYLMRSLTLYRKRQLELYASPPHWPLLIYPRSRRLTTAKNILWALVWVCGCFALMGPKGNLHYRSVEEAAVSAIPKRIPHDVIFVVDTSGSMGVADLPNGETRLNKAKELMREILNLLDGQNVSVYALTSELISLVPSTTDYLFTRLVIDQLHLNEGDIGGTNFTKSLETLKNKLFSTPSSKLRTIILLSDGGDNQVEQLEGEAKLQAIKKIASMIPNPEEHHLRLFTIGIGSENGGVVPNVTFNKKPVTSKLQADLLKELANVERGQYLEAENKNTGELLNLLFTKINQEPRYEENLSLNREVMTAKASDILYDLYFQLPLGLAFVFLILSTRLPDTLPRRL